MAHIPRAKKAVKRPVKKAVKHPVKKAGKKTVEPPAWRLLSPAVTQELCISGLLGPHHLVSVQLLRETVAPPGSLPIDTAGIAVFLRGHAPVPYAFALHSHGCNNRKGLEYKLEVKLRCNLLKAIADLEKQSV